MFRKCRKLNKKHIFYKMLENVWFPAQTPNKTVYVTSKISKGLKLVGKLTFSQ